MFALENCTDCSSTSARSIHRRVGLGTPMQDCALHMTKHLRSGIHASAKTRPLPCSSALIGGHLRALSRTLRRPPCTCPRFRSHFALLAVHILQQDTRCQIPFSRLPWLNQHRYTPAQRLLTTVSTRQRWTQSRQKTPAANRTTNAKSMATYSRPLRLCSKTDASILAFSSSKTKVRFLPFPQATRLCNP
jgi:hypothetical protein